jgi:hypothetical protein
MRNLLQVMFYMRQKRRLKLILVVMFVKRIMSMLVVHAFVLIVRQLLCVESLKIDLGIEGHLLSSVMKLMEKVMQNMPHV